jgi:hypothetical protein
VADSHARGRKNEIWKYFGASVAAGSVGVILIYALANIDSLERNFSYYFMGGTMPVQHRLTIVSGTIYIPPGGYQYFTFWIPENVSDPRIEGKFSATGENDSDIRVAVLDQYAFANFQMHHDVKAYYSSGHVIGGEIFADMPTAQTLYLLFDNSSSATNKKKVDANIYATYTN